MQTPPPHSKVRSLVARRFHAFPTYVRDTRHEPLRLWMYARLEGIGFPDEEENFPDTPVLIDRQSCHSIRYHEEPRHPRRDRPYDPDRHLYAYPNPVPHSSPGYRRWP